MSELEIFIFSLFSSTVAPILGIGGGTLNVPFLTLYIGIAFPAAVTASLLAGVCMSISASFRNIRTGKAYVGTAFRLLPPIMLGAAISAYIPIESNLLFLLFSVFMFVIVYLMHTSKKGKFKIKNKFVFYPVLFVIGIVSGLLGIGGGVILVPLLMLTQDLGIRRSVATSSFMLMFEMFAGFLSHLSHGDLDPAVALPLAVPALFMGYAGAYLMTERIERKTLRNIISVYLLFVALMMGVKAF
ncbi:MAG: sulfite exporter TauE/SafE family protein [Candidatus Micrarchaeota archaeon]